MYEYVFPPCWLAKHVQDPRITVGEYTYFDRHISLGVWAGEDRIEIGNFCSLAKNVTIFGGGEHIISRATSYPFKVFLEDSEPVELNAEVGTKGATIIGNDVWIGHRATILSGVRIGNGAVIGAGAVVTKNVPDYAIAVGNPGRLIRYRFKPETIKRLLELCWWDWELSKIIANLDLLYENPDNWPFDIQFREAQVDPLTIQLSGSLLENLQRIWGSH
uniref:PuwL n=1 Tax=Symplocastrum muelleri NIVA-CYA 644 TaxID=2303159 RepID=A0A346GB72_9CYAN|nr:PuwL [Symplocastrum muelleri NIVA-CYA 644]